ncbi:MAG: TonB-dependent receptor [Bacteroidales bacterium]|nr:TonB-dependent receptor [Bacteroidales bacterium]
MKRLGKTLLTAAACFLAGGVFAQKTMSGIIYDNEHNPLSGAMIMIEGTKVLTLSNMNGVYHLVVPKEYENSMVVFRYSGFLEHTEPVTEGTKNITLELELEKEFKDIFVSTQKRLQSNIEVPIAVSVIDQAKLDELNTVQIDDVSGVAPGFNAIIQGQNKGGLSIRGVTSDGLESFFQPRISVFINGVSSSRLQSSIIELYDMERVEVVKGPQGTLFGRGAEIGAVHYITKRPQKDTSAKVSLNYGGYNQRGAQGMVNFMAGERFANRFAFSYDYHDGYIKNLAGGTLNGKNAIAVRNTTSFFQSDKSLFNLILDYEHDDTPGISFKSNKVAPLGSDTSPFTAAYLNGGKDLCVKRHLFGLTLEYDKELNSQFDISNTFGVRGAYSDEYFDADGCYLPLMYCDEEADALQFSEEFRLNWDNGSNMHGFVGVGAMYEYSKHYLNINSAQSYLFPICVAPTMKNKLSVLPSQVSMGVAGAIKQALPSLQANGLSVSDDMINGVASAIESQLNSRLDAWFDGSTWQQTPDFFGDTRSTVENVLVDALGQVIGSKEAAQQMVGGFMPMIEESLTEIKKLSNVPMDDTYYENQTNYAKNFETDIFADFNWNVVGNLYFTLGLRGTYERQESGFLSTSMTAPIVGTMIYSSTNGETIWREPVNDFSWVGRFITNYMLNKTNNVYLSFSKGRRPSVAYYNYKLNEEGVRDVTKLRDEEIYNYELGLKGSIFKNSLMYSLAAYFYNWRHFQNMLSYMMSDGTYAYTNTDKGLANCAGVEASIKYYFKRYVTFFADYNYFHGKYAKKDEDGNPQNFAGNSFRLSPESTFDFGFDVVIPVRNKFNIYFRPNYTSKDDMYFEDSNLPYLLQEEYGVLNMNMGIMFNHKRMSYDFCLWGKNITNTEYIIDAGNAGQTIGFPTFVAGAPANFGVKLTVGFK